MRKTKLTGDAHWYGGCWEFPGPRAASTWKVSRKFSHEKHAKRCKSSGNYRLSCRLPEILTSVSPDSRLDLLISFPLLSLLFLGYAFYNDPHHYNNNYLHYLQIHWGVPAGFGELAKPGRDIVHSSFSEDTATRIKINGTLAARGQYFAMFSVSNLCTEILRNRSKSYTAAHIHAECSNLPNDNGCPPSLSKLLDELLNPSKDIGDRETINWCKWLIASGHTPEKFAKTGTPCVFYFFKLHSMETF